MFLLFKFFRCNSCWSNHAANLISNPVLSLVFTSDLNDRSASGSGRVLMSAWKQVDVTVSSMEAETEGTEDFLVFIRFRFCFRRVLFQVKTNPSVNARQRFLPSQSKYSFQARIGTRPKWRPTILHVGQVISWLIIYRVRRRRRRRLHAKQRKKRVFGLETFFWRGKTKELFSTSWKSCDYLIMNTTSGDD